jgi:signal transduction histidine kinase
VATILTIDTDPGQLEAQASLLQAAGHEVHQASTPAQALDLLRSALVDLVVIEPASQPNGVGFCWEIRRLTPHCPLLVVSASAAELDIVNALTVGADDYLTKPVSAVLFRARVEALLRRADRGLSRAGHQYSSMRRMLEAAWEVPLKRTSRSPFPDLAKALAGSLGATYCRFATREGNRLRLRASAGHRLPQREDQSWPLATQPHAREALRAGKSAVLDFRVPQSAATPERDQLFTRTTRTAVLIPFHSDRVEGLLVVGEERGSRAEPFEGEYLAILEYVAHRLADVLRMIDLMQRERIAQRRRQLLAARRVERARLSRELHDQVGQSLSGLLFRLRLARSEGSMSLADIDALEKAAEDALDAARSVAYDLRRQGGAADAFQDARDYAETVLGAAGCQVTWTDRRGDAPIDSQAARAAARVIKESVTNVVRHSHARSTEIRIEQANRRLRVTIRDDGQGFVPFAGSIHRNGRGLGLLGNRERLSQLGGTFEVVSAPGSGTSVTLEIPWRRRAPAVARAG